MPKRTNLFQDVVALLYGRLAGDASIEESALLPHRTTGRKREVDVVIRAKVAGHPLVVGIEASATTRRATVEWVERMAAKHDGLETDKLILVAEAGFTADARRLALSRDAIPVASGDLRDGDPRDELLKKFELFVGTVVHFVLDDLWVLAAPPTRGRVTGGTYGIFTPEGAYVGPCRAVAKAVMRAEGQSFLEAPEVLEAIARLEGGGETSLPLMLRIYPPWDGFDVEFAMKLSGDGWTEYCPVLEFRGKGRIEIESRAVSFRHRVIGDQPVAYAEGSLLGNPVSFIISDPYDEEVTIVIRSRAEGVAFVDDAERAPETKIRLGIGGEARVTAWFADQ